MKRNSKRTPFQGPTQFLTLHVWLLSRRHSYLFACASALLIRMGYSHVKVPVLTTRNYPGLCIFQALAHCSYLFLTLRMSPLSPQIQSEFIATKISGMYLGGAFLQ